MRCWRRLHRLVCPGDVEVIAALVSGWKVGLAALVIGLAVGFGTGWTVHGWKDAADAKAQDKADLKAAGQVVRQTHRSAEITQDVGARVEQARERVRVETRTIIERIPVYVSAETDLACTVPVGFVRVHDAAAEGSAEALPDSPGEPADAPSGVPLSAVAETVAFNYAEALDWRERLIGWQTWYEEQRAAWERPAPE